MPVTIQVPSGVSMLSSFVFDSTITASEVRIEGSPGTVISRDSVGRRRRLQVSDDDPPIFVLRSSTTTHVILRDLRIEGKIRVEGGSLEVNNCTLDGLHSEADAAASGQGAIGLHVSGGHVVLSQTTIVSFEGGGIEVAGLRDAKLLQIESSVIRLNGRSGAARMGGISTIGGTVDVANSLIEDNGFASRDCDAGCVRGGGLRVDASGNAILRAGTLLWRNKAYEGRSIYVTRDSREPDAVQGIPFPVVYHLPAPPAHFVVIVERLSTISQLRKGSLIDDNYPFECAAGNFGRFATREVQSTPRCSGLCPAGYYCPLATVEPIECSKGTYCPEGSTAEISCPPGTYGGEVGLSNAAQCLTCGAGTQCPARSAAPTACAAGSHAPRDGSASCSPCSPGLYQDQTMQTSCKLCISGHYCPAGSASPIACTAGYFSKRAGLNASSQCTVREDQNLDRQHLGSAQP